MLIAKAKMLGLDQAVTGIVVGYVVIYVVALGLALRLPKDKSTKALAAVMVTAVFGLPVLMLNQKSQDAQKIVTTQKSEYMAKYEPAKAIFDKLCREQSAPIIKRTVADVEGVLLLKRRPALGGKVDEYDKDQFWAGAALFGERRAGDGDVEYFLIDRDWYDPRAKLAGHRPVFVASIRTRGTHGFRYVDVVATDGKSRNRVIARVDSTQNERPVTGIAFTWEETTNAAPRYAVTYEDNVDSELRKHWIAGTTIKVIDTGTNEIIGSQSYWRWDTGFGSTAGSRSPWPTAKEQCPRLTENGTQTQAFVYSLLKAKQGN